MVPLLADEFQAKVNKVFGPFTLVSASSLIVPKRFTTGCLALDVALGGGWPGNQWSEVVGNTQAGKTATVLKTVAANQRIDPEFSTFWIAAEIYDADQASALGVDNDRVFVCAEQRMEFALDMMLQATESRAFDAVILDSYPALIPQDEDEKPMDELTVGSGAKTFARYWRKAGKATKRANEGDRPFLGIVVNQFRDKIGGFARFGTPETTPGGHAKDYAYFARLKLTQGGYITEQRPGHGTVPVGQTIKYKTIKNKSAAPQREAEVDFYFAHAPTLGFRRGDYDLGKDYVTVGVDFGVIAKSGGWLYFDERKWQGRNNLETDIKAEPELAATLAAQVMAKIRAQRINGNGQT